MANVKTYYLAPNFDFQPGGKISLGNIIADPFKPHRVLTTASNPPTADEVEETIQYDYRNEHNKVNGVDMSIWAQLLHSIGLKFGSAYNQNTAVEYSMTSLKTIQYRTEPTTEEIMVRVQETKIKNIMQPNGYRSYPVYMITALKIAERLSVSIGKDTQKNGSLDGSIPLSESVTTGASLSVSRHQKDKESFRLEKDVVFAYQLLEIGYKGWLEKTLHLDEYKNRAALLSDNLEKAEESVADAELEVRSTGSHLRTQMEIASIRELKLRDAEQNYVFVSLEG